MSLPCAAVLRLRAPAAFIAAKTEVKVGSTFQHYASSARGAPGLVAELAGSHSISICTFSHPFPCDEAKLLSCSGLGQFAVDTVTLLHTVLHGNPEAVNHRV